MRPASQRFFIHSFIYLRILCISYLATFLGTNILSVLICRKAVNQSIVTGLHGFQHLYYASLFYNNIQIIHKLCFEIGNGHGKCERHCHRSPTSENCDRCSLEEFSFQNHKQLFCNHETITFQFQIIVNVRAVSILLLGGQYTH